MKKYKQTPAMTGHVSLKTMLKLTGLWECGDIRVFLRKNTEIFRNEYKCMTVSELKNAMDLEHLIVVHVCPYFWADKYEGLLFTIHEPKERRYAS